MIMLKTMIIVFLTELKIKNKKKVVALRFISFRLLLDHSEFWVLPPIDSNKHTPAESSSTFINWYTESIRASKNEPVRERKNWTRISGIELTAIEVSTKNWMMESAG